jgi:aryl-alcohol dehydrogenase-like predicted oxidoreductase
MPPAGQAAPPLRAPTTRLGNCLLCSPFRRLWLGLKIVTSASSIGKLGLGTVQFGLAYGVTNERGQVPPAEVAAILAAALSAGIDLFDTAAAYGASERVLGNALGSWADVRVVSKLPALATDRIGEAEIEQCRTALEKSLALLRRRSIYALLLHRPDDLRKPGAERLVALLEELKSAGTVAKIGVSVYDRPEIDLALDRLPLDAVQVPVNLLDQRLLRDGTLDRLRRRNVEVHARSAFLQGALLVEPTALPGHFAPYRDRLTAVGIAAERAGLSRLALCLRFVLEQPTIDRVIVGVTGVAELRQSLAAASDPTPLPDGLSALAGDDPRLFNPALWPAKPRP